jgi:hypothetical protein
MNMTEKFETVVSKINKPITYLLTAILWLVIIIVVIVTGVISENIYSHFINYIKYDLSTFFMLIFALLLLILCGIALIMSLTYRKKEKIRKAVIDEKGLLFTTGKITSLIRSYIVTSNSPNSHQVMLLCLRQREDMLNPI